jgi:hypothetical protein
MITYIQRNDDPAIPPPYDFPEITMMSFRLPATVANLQALCDKYLNIGKLEERGFEYRALFGFVDMELVTYPKMMFAQEPFSGWGFASQQELYFRFFVWKFISLGGILFPDPIPELFFPFMFVDNSWSMTSGRAVLGFPKVMAQFDPTPVLNAPYPITASALVLEKFLPETKLDWKPVVEILPGNGPAPAPAGLWPWIGIAGEIADPYLNELLEALLAKIPDAFSTVQLKQSRDTPTEACYQAVVSTPFTPSNVEASTQLPAATITVNTYASLDIPGCLGFQAGTPLQPSLQYSVELDMSMGRIRDLFVNR